MESVIKAVIIYGFLLVMIRLSGRRTVGQMTPFDLVLLLIIGSATQRALLGQDFSIVNAVIVVLTLVLLDVVLSLLKRDFKGFAKLVDGVPMVVVQHGCPLKDRLYRARIDEEDVMAAARRHHGIERIEDIKFAVLEADGHLSVIPYDSPPRPQPERAPAAS